jgi:hypothetical protein
MIWAAAISVWARARNWQSQRVTRRSFFGPGRTFSTAAAVFQPVPAQSGQTSAGTAIVRALTVSALVAGGFDALCSMSPLGQNIHLDRNSSPSTLHEKDGSAQAGSGSRLCTSCEPWGRAVEGLGKSSPVVRNPARVAPIRAEGVRNRLPARIFTVDNRRRRRRIQNGQVSQLSHYHFRPGSGCVRTRPARREYE